MSQRRYRKDLENQLEYIGLALGMKVGSSGDRDCLTIDGNNRMYRVEYVLPTGGAEAFFGPERRTEAELYEFLMFARIAIAKTKEKFEPKPAPHVDGEADLHFWAKPDDEDDGE